ncbi:phage tail tape measure protein, TP901 family, core region [Lactococcus chungangensis CAU 28 = DSM 22330]|uniref:Phage tail tape measure protein, TP901 family, core region n=1 Tax=Pseudolactococcus chungangensis CAU 28 = DSM 22330 TaxID=1122154 RepID=A0A1K2H8R6_9LACT|nr:phage tail tape measure protein [Lactococcus chungangensis]PCS02046.1 phage tail tape measure protein, TP901 family, core region [Lactococcus chungangensis CAU 28 = DSM 22330]SFZ73103.1 Phage-related minor tail protein [Lactococcus chungangensis CAU 28 = DSM 22330]
MGKTKESDVVLNFKMDGQIQYAQTIKEINQVMNTAALEYKNHVSAMGNDATATEKLTASKKKLEIQLEGAEKRTQMLREEYEKSVKETGAYSEQSNKLYKQLVNSETGENKLKNALVQTNDALKEQGNISVDTAKKIQKIEEAGEKVTGIGKKTSVGVTAPILAAGAAGLAAFNDIDEQLDGIISKTGATGDEADSLAESFENVGSNTHLGLDVVGDAIGSVRQQLGLLGPELEQNADYAMKFAEINDSDVSTSVENAKQALDAYNLSNKDFQSVLDATTLASQKTGVSVDDLFKKSVEGAPQIKALGLSYSEGAMLLGQLEKAGVDSSATLGSLSKASVAYAKQGKSLSDGLNETQKSILGAKDQTEALTIASEVFGTKGAVRMVEAIQRGTLDLNDLAEASKNSAGVVGTTFDETLDPIDKANQAMNQAKFALADIGEQVQIALLPTFEAAISLLTRFKDWFSSLSPETQQMIVRIALVVAAIGPLLVIIGTLMGSITKIVSGIKAVQSVFGAMSAIMAANPFVLIIAAIALFVVAFVLAYQKIEWFRNGVNAFMGGVKDIFVQGFNFLTGYLGSVFGGIEQNFNNFLSAGQRVFNGFVDFITGVFTGNWKQAWDGIVNIFGGIFDGIVAFAKAPLNLLIGLINGVIGGLNKIKLPKWVPGIGGKGINIGKIPYLATGGHLINGQAIVGEAGPELLSMQGGKTTVTPLSDEEKRKGIGGKVQGSVTVEQHNHFGKVDANNPSELAKINRQLKQASVQAIIAKGGIPI